MSDKTWPSTGSASIHIATTPEAAYDYVTDLDKLPTLSPEYQRCEFIEGSTEIAEGAIFRGHNENGGYEWSAECRVTVADRGREFAFVVPPKWEYATTWSYRFEQTDGGTTVTESFDSPMLADPEVYPGKIEGPLRTTPGSTRNHPRQPQGRPRDLSRGRVRYRGVVCNAACAGSPQHLS